MTLDVREIPCANQVIQRRGLSYFKKAVDLKHLLDAMPQAKRPSRNYHNPQILNKLGIGRFYVSLDSDINVSLPISSVKRNKTVWVPCREARRILESRADELLPCINDELDGKFFPGDDAEQT